MTEALNHLIWIDLEMTGLSPVTDRILEVATVITDAQLQVVAEGPVIAIRQSAECLAAMDAWNTQHHGDSGLTDRCLQSDFDEALAEQQTLTFLSQHVPAGTSPMCGNSICQDRRFLAKYMPSLERYFHYRHLDVSTIKELARRWAPQVYEGFTKESSHQALADIHDSIEELRHYRDHFFRLP